MHVGNKIIVIGGAACGPKAAARARRCDPRAKITVIESTSLISYAGCGLPYYISGTVSKRGSLLLRNPEQFKSAYNIDVLINTRCESIDRDNHRVEVRDLPSQRLTTLDYDKLVLATGATPLMPPIAGKELAGINVLKDIPDADAILDLAISQNGHKAVIVGAGLIGLEMTQALAERGLNVTLVEAMHGLLPSILDYDLASLLAKYLMRKGVSLRLGEKVVRFEGELGKVRRVVTNKAVLDADIVIVAIGVCPNIELASKAGLQIGPTGAIAVNQYLQTSDPDIYAGGDCVECTHLVTGKKVYAPMGSTANKHGRVIGTNVSGGKEVFPGVVGTAVVKVFDYNIGSVGLREKTALDAGFEPVIALAPNLDHAGYYPDAHDVLLWLVADRRSGRILGGQAIGRGDVAKRIDVLATALTLGADVDALANLDLAYAPPYNTAMDPLHSAANVIRNKLSNMAHGLTPTQVKAKLDNNEDFVLLDVRNPEEWRKWRIEAPQVRLVPQSRLRETVAEFPRDKEIVVMCRRGARAYQAERTLRGEGFENIEFMEGSLTAWPYEVFGGETE